MKRTVKCPTAYTNGSLLCMLADSRGTTELLLWRILFCVQTDPAIQGGFSCVSAISITPSTDENLNVTGFEKSRLPRTIINL